MSVGSYVTWTPTRYRNPLPLQKILTVAALILGVGAVVIAVQQPVVRKALPAALQTTVLKAENLLDRQSRGDLIVLKKDIGAQKVVKKQSGVQKIGKKFVAFEHEKRFVLDEKRVAHVSVLTFPTKDQAAAYAKRQGDTGEDYLQVGRPSFFKIHGLDKKNDYYMKSLTLRDDQVIVVTVTRKLAPAERKLAMGPRYEQMMNDYFEEHFPTVAKITASQIDRLALIASK